MTVEGLKYDELQRLYDKFLKIEEDKAAGQNYDTRLASIQKDADTRRRAALQEFAQGVIDKKEYERQLKEIERQETAARIVVSGIYFERVKKAGDNLVADRKKQEEQVTTDLLTQAEQGAHSPAGERSGRKTLQANLLQQPG